MDTTTRIAMALVIVLCACSSKNGDTECDPGDTRPCLCPGGLPGEEPCMDDGTWRGVCTCHLPDTSTDADDTVTPDVVEDTPEDTTTDTATDVDDDSPPCDGTPCGIIPNCGCPPGEKCSVHPTTRERHCVDAGTLTVADPCESDTECEAETLCARMYTYTDEEEAICFGYCRDDSDCPGDASICLHALTPETEVGYCTIGCDLLTSDPCPDFAKCKWLRTTGGEDYTDCIADVGTGLLATPCTGENICYRGLFCSGGNCIEYCRISPAPDTCTFGCRQFTIGGVPVDLTFDGVSYGYCWP